MKERVKITITPSISDSNLLTVEDAMQQVLDYFDLLRAADKSLDDKESIVWRLKSVTTNSPFTVEAEPYGHDPAISVERHAAIVMRRFHDGMDAVIHDKEIPSWLENDKHLQNTLKRNLNGIGRTDINLGDRLDTIVISSKIADDARKNLEKRKLAKEENLTHSCYGSVEGSITSVSRYYGKPCFYLHPRQGDKEIRCVVSEDVAAEIGTAHSISEVWGNGRVIVEGLVSYNAKGLAENIQVMHISGIDEKDFSLDDIYDPDFTGNLSVKEYQEQ